LVDNPIRVFIESELLLATLRTMIWDSRVIHHALAKNDTPPAAEHARLALYHNHTLR
jgi:hypothetical protein